MEIGYEVRRKEQDERNNGLDSQQNEQDKDNNLVAPWTRDHMQESPKGNVTCCTCWYEREFRRHPIWRCDWVLSNAMEKEEESK